MADIVGDTAVAVAFLQSWVQGGPWPLTAIIPDGTTETRTFRDEQKAHAWIERYQDERNLYWGVNRPGRDITKKATKTDISHALACHVDVDPRKGCPLAEERERIVALVESMEPLPSDIIDSGGGYQCFWRFYEALPLVDGALERVEAVNRMMARRYGGDVVCFTVDHVMRIPGTVNLLTRAKKEKGRTEKTLARVVRQTSARYRLDDLIPPHVSGLPISQKYRDLILGIGAAEYNNDRSRMVLAVLAAMIRAGCSDEAMTAVLSDTALVISDHFKGKADGEVERQIRRARDKVKVDGQRRAEDTAQEMLRAPWPAPLAPAAFRGLAGEIIRAIEPHSEADPAALLVQFLVTFGCYRGREPYYMVGETEHHTNLFAVLVGDTGERKGTAWQDIRGPFLRVGAPWDALRFPGTVSSGEGLVTQVQDEITKQETDSKTGVSRTVVTTPGVEDKRFLVQEEEFAGNCLKVMKRENNTLSAILRSLWDSGNYRIMTKNSKTQTTGAHVGLVGHCTEVELTKNLDFIDMLNGFANRILFIYVRRSKLLPFGGDRPVLAAALQPLLVRLQRALEFNPAYADVSPDKPTEVSLSSYKDKRPFECSIALDAHPYWTQIYKELAAAKEATRGTTLGAMTARSEPIVIRLAMIYALLDETAEIQQSHLESALAVWRYAEASAAHVWGYGDADGLTVRVLTALVEAGTAGLTREELRGGALQHNQKATKIKSVLRQLEQRGLARKERVATRTRPAERWWAVRPLQDDEDDEDDDD